MTKSKNNLCLLLGTNLGDKRANLDASTKLLLETIGDLILASPIFETEPWGNKDQPSFYNQALKIGTNLGPLQLMPKILQIEKELGRARESNEKWAPRIIDIDILYYNDISLKLHNITIPHPEIPNRRFVLEPLCTIFPDLLHPDLALTQRQLLEQCKDPLSVKIIN